MIKTLFVLLASATALVFAAQGNRAIALLKADGVYGNVTFTEEADCKVRVTGTIVGLLAGDYGFHVHEKGDITGGCASTLSHYNPHGKQHGHPEDANRHVGDLGNVRFDASRTANINFVDSLLKLSGPDSIIGRGLVLHAGTDDFGKTDHPDSKTTGNAGGRVACGVIGILDSGSKVCNSANTAFTLTSIFTLVSVVFVSML